MNLKKLTLSMVAILASAGVLFAQQSKTDERVEFRSHWNLQVQGGVAYTLGETSFGELLSPAAFLSANYKFHHAWGVRVGLGGWQGRGVAVTQQNADYAWNFLQLNGDVMLDFSSLVGGYNHKRLCSVFAFAGVGFLYGFDNDEAASITYAQEELTYLWDSKAFVAGRFGLGLDFRVSECVSLNLEANANFLSDHFNSKKADNCDWQFNLLAGASFRFGKNHQPSTVYAAKVAAEQAAALAAAEQAAREKEAAEKLAAEQAAAAQAAAEKAEAERLAAEQCALAAHRAAMVEEHSENIFFLIGSAHIRKSEAQKIDALVEWLNANEDYRVSVVGYADKETGSSVTNARLSERRAQNVKKQLLAAGIAEERIDIAHKGDSEQPFTEPAQNRVVICTLE